ncbi:nucleotide sugar dehydrogenase [Allobranchiibius sp. CTAmp26]|nr:nucleotide sugar dehydrogenase [Allobranchiibius sp. CTAmp26]
METVDPAPAGVDRGPARSYQSVAVVGLGYVGLPTALSLLDAGAEVIGIDISSQRLDNIRRGDVDLLSRDLGRLQRTTGHPRWFLCDDFARLSSADAVLICVPTPVTENLTPDLDALRGACAAVVGAARSGQTIILTSTTHIGATRELLSEPLSYRGLIAGRDIHVAFSPERIDPGVADHVPENTPRVVGGMTPSCTESAAQVLELTSPTMHRLTSPEAAEMTKLVENTFRAVNIALANEFADVAGEFALSVSEVINAAATKPYGFTAFFPGPGVGGHCIPCDPHYLLWQLRGRRRSAPLIDAAMTAIALRPRRVVARAEQVLSQQRKPLHDARILVLGVAYKPGVADLRESPALEILRDLQAHNANVSFCDPYVPSLMLDGEQLEHCENPQDERWDLVIVHTRHPEMDLRWLVDQPLVLDSTYRLSEVARAALV